MSWAEIVRRIEARAVERQMSDEEFAALSAKTQILAEANIGAYKTRVALLAALGYVPPCVFLTLFLGASAWLAHGLFTGTIPVYLGAKVGIICLLLGFVVGNALWVRTSPPTGIPIKAQDAPKLFAFLDEVQRRMGIKIDEVLIDDQLNACVVQRPRLGVFGWHKTTLVIGLPLLYGNTLEQAEATLIHEIGHISGNHGKFSSWIYNLYTTWNTLLGDLRASGSWLYLIMFPFFQWYLPFFMAYTMTLVRTHEREADRLATELVNARANAESLILMYIQGHYLMNHVWKNIYESVSNESEPPKDVFSRIAREMNGSEITEEQAEKWYQEALNFETDVHDTHPCLLDRLADIGYPSSDPNVIKQTRLNMRELVTIERNAADVLLGEKAKDLANQHSELWYQAIVARWRDQHKLMQGEKEKLEKLESKQPVELNEKEQAEVAYLVARLRSYAEAAPLYEKVLAEQPENADAHFQYGMLLLEKEDEAGVPLIDKAMTLNRKYTESGCQTCLDYYQRRAKKDKVEQYKKQLSEFYQEVNRAQAERGELSERNCFMTHDLEPAAVEALVGLVSQFKEVKAAYLVRKEVTILPDLKQYVLAFKDGSLLPSEDSRDRIQLGLLHGIAEHPEINALDVMLLPLDHYEKNTCNKVTAVPNSNIFERELAKR